jgi:hypothetical protein
VCINKPQYHTLYVQWEIFACAKFTKLLSLVNPLEETFTVLIFAPSPQLCVLCHNPIKIFVFPVYTKNVDRAKNSRYTRILRSKINLPQLIIGETLYPNVRS